MNRRDFLKSFGTVAIAAPVVSLPALSILDRSVKELVAPDVIKRVDFSQRATFRRYSDGRWFLEFASDERLDVEFKNDMVIEIEDKEYILNEITDIQISTEFLGWRNKRETDRDYIHWLTGNKWQVV
jgi:hypothetical protein